MAATRWPPPHLTRETISGRRPARTGPIHPAESFVPAKTFREKEILPTHLPAEKERMISGRTFAREMIALRREGDKARRADFSPTRAKSGTTAELRTHSEFGASLSVTPGALPSSVLELSLEEAVQPDISFSPGSALRKQNRSISFSSQRCQPPPLGRKTHVAPPHHPVRRPYRRRPHLLN